MSETYRKESRKDWHRAGDTQASNDDIQLGCLQRIADAVELMAKRHQELIDAKDRAERSAAFHRDCNERAARRLSAMRGQITKLNKRLAEST